jgi:PilZ domain
MSIERVLGIVAGTRWCSREVAVESPTAIGDTGAEAGAGAGAGGKERRRSRRFLCNGTAEVMVFHPECLFRGEIRDISQNGCFVITRAHVHLERLAEAEVRFKLNNRQFRTQARVMNVRPGDGVGFEFAHANAKVEEQVNNLIHELNASTPNQNT